MRDWNDPKYVQARANVRKRDKYKCRRCHKVSGEIHVHHIRPYHSHPELLCEESNLICLCRRCHNLMKGNEEAYIQMCVSLLNPQAAIDVKRMLRKLKQEDEDNELSGN